MQIYFRIPDRFDEVVSFSSIHTSPVYTINDLVELLFLQAILYQVLGPINDTISVVSYVF